MPDMHRIMIVDDDPKNAKILRMLLEEDYELAVAHTGEEALELLPQFKPELVLLDIMMSGIDGYEVCRKIKTNDRYSSTKVLIVSSRAMGYELEQGYEAGADNYFCKPFDHQAIVATVASMLDSGANTREAE